MSSPVSRYFSLLPDSGEGTVLYCTVLYNTGLYKTVLYNTVLYNTVQYNVLLYLDIPFSYIRWFSVVIGKEDLHHSICHTVCDSLSDPGSMQFSHILEQSPRDWETTMR